MRERFFFPSTFSWTKSSWTDPSIPLLLGPGGVPHSIRLAAPEVWSPLPFLPLGLSHLPFAHLSLGVLDLCLQPLDHAGQLIDLIPRVAQVVTVLASCHSHLLVLGRRGMFQGFKGCIKTTVLT